MYIRKFRPKKFYNVEPWQSKIEREGEKEKENGDESGHGQPESKLLIHFVEVEVIVVAAAPFGGFHVDHDRFFVDA